MTASHLLAWCVHLYTAMGAVVAFFSLLAIENGEFRQAFWLMALAVAIDATDGTLARAGRVKELIPRFNGDRLEDIIDYLNYVMVPSWLLLRAELLPPADAKWLAVLPLIASAYGFCQAQAKTSDNFFLGFPSYWNVIVFYLYVLYLPLWVNGFVIVVFSILVFVPIRYLYPSRSPLFRRQTNFLGALWGIALLVIIYQLPEPSTVVVVASLGYPAYYVLLSLWLEWRRITA